MGRGPASVSTGVPADTSRPHYFLTPAQESSKKMAFYFKLLITNCLSPIGCLSSIQFGLFGSFRAGFSPIFGGLLHYVYLFFRLIFVNDNSNMNSV
jgi:hypothetical protein